MSVDRLSALDSSFVWFEKPGAPIHVGAVATFEAAPLLDERGRLRLADLRKRFDARIDALPRLRRRLVSVPYNLDRPRWVDDPDFDIANHVGEVQLEPPGDEAAFRRLAAELQSQSLPRDRPLWDLRIVTGLAGDRVGLVERVHHALVDGISGVDIAGVLLDLDPDAPVSAGTPWSPDPPPDDSTLLAEGLQERMSDPERAARAMVNLVRNPSRLARTAGTLAGGLGTLVGDGILAARTTLNRPPTGDRHLAWVRTRLDDLRALGHDVEATVNDVVLAAVAGGLRWLLLERGERLSADLTLKVLVPVSLRGVDEHGALGNRVTALPAPLPVGIGDPQARLSAIAQSMHRLKARPVAESIGLMLDAADALPAAATRLITQAVDHQRFVNLVVTNVPGSPVPLYAAGARMLEAFPVVPLGANLPVGVAVLSYDGALTITVTTDDHLGRDADVFAAGIERSLEQYGVSPAKPRLPSPQVAPASNLSEPAR
jgi:diacylglycerol O-acyltransferase / wax synthase